MKNPLIIAHRGACAEAPENTLAALRRAAELGVKWVELDVRFTADGEVVVIHDRTVNRTTNGRGAVERLTLAQLRQLDAGSWFHRRFQGERIPAFQEVLELAKSANLHLVIELKMEGDPPPGFENALLEPLRALQMQSRSILQSFNHRALRQLSRADSSQGLAALFDKNTRDPVGETLSLGARLLAVKWNLLNPVIMADARLRQAGVFAWTVNRERAMRKMKTLGVDGVITNHPLLAFRVLDR